MPDLLPWPFSLPGRFLDQLGYAGAIEAFESPASARPVHLEAAELPPEPLWTHCQTCPPSASSRGAARSSTASRPAAVATTRARWPSCATWPRDPCRRRTRTSLTSGARRCRSDLHPGGCRQAPVRRLSASDKRLSASGKAPVTHAPVRAAHTRAIPTLLAPRVGNWPTARPPGAPHQGVRQCPVASRFPRSPACARPSWGCWSWPWPWPAQPAPTGARPARRGRC